jgi:hypothetical protein
MVGEISIFEFGGGFGKDIFVVEAVIVVVSETVSSAGDWVEGCIQPFSFGSLLKC